MVYNNYRNYKFKSVGATTIYLMSDIFNGTFPYNSISQQAPPKLRLGKSFFNYNEQNKMKQCRNYPS